LRPRPPFADAFVGNHPTPVWGNRWHARQTPAGFTGEAARTAQPRRSTISGQVQGLASWRQQRGGGSWTWLPVGSWPGRSFWGRPGHHPSGFVRPTVPGERQAATGTTGEQPRTFAARQAAVTSQFYNDPARNFTRRAAFPPGPSVEVRGPVSRAGRRSRACPRAGRRKRYGGEARPPASSGR
jgi:hypothetical protein